MNTPTGKHIVATAALLIGAVLLFEWTGIDLWLQDLLYDQQGGAWMVDRDSPVARLLFYDGVKAVFILAALSLAAALALFRRKAVVQRNRRGLLILLMSMIAVPLVVGALKDATNVPCPRDIDLFGGNHYYVRLFDSHPPGTEKSFACYPAGHASGGFSLLALLFLFQSPGKRKRAVALALTLGWLTGGYKMLIGDHFLSHTVVTMILAWLIVQAIAYWVLRVPPAAVGRGE